MGFSGVPRLCAVPAGDEAGVVAFLDGDDVAGFGERGGALDGGERKFLGAGVVVGAAGCDGVSRQQSAEFERFEDGKRAWH